MTIKQLQKEYGAGKLFVEIADRSEAINQIDSKASCCWGAGQDIDGSGWVQLASPSPSSKNSKRTVFVCKKDLISN